VLATVDDWLEKSRWFYSVNETTVVHLPDYGLDAKPFEYDQEIVDFTHKLIAPYKTHQDKRKAILHWVAQHIRYSGITMGKGEGYTLHPGIMTFRDRAGVCKDIAGMSLTMFRAAGYKAYPTMTMAGARVERIPADQFNHCVVAVDISDEGIESDNLKGREGFEKKYEMYDATWAPNSMDIWSRAEGDQNINIGSPEGEDLTAIRTYTAEENRYSLDSKVTIDKDGNLSGILVIKGSGGADGRLRRVISYSGNQLETKNRLTGFLSGIHPGAELVKYSYEGFEDYWHPMTLTIEYKIPGFAALYGNGMHFTPPMAKFPLNATYFFTALRIGDLKERKYPILNWMPQQAVVEETITLPAGYKLDTFEPVKKGGEFAYFNAAAEQDKKGVKLNYMYSVSDRTVMPEEYPQVKETVDGWKEFADKQIHLWK